MSQLYDTWRWMHFGTESGLPSEKIIGVYESGNGDVWAHTSGGLARFDGYQWLTAAIPGMQPTEVEDVRIASDTAGILLNYNYRVYSLEKDAVRLVSFSGEEGFIPTYAAWREPAGTLIVQGDSLLYRVRGTIASHLLSPYSPQILRSIQPPVATNYIIATEGGGWLKAGASLLRYVSGEWKMAFRSPDGFLRVLYFAENAGGSGMAVLEPVTGTVRLFEWSSRGPLKELSNEDGDLIQSIAVCPDGRLLLLYSSGELRLREKGKWSWLPSLPPPVEKPRFLKFSTRGDLWVGGDKGLFLCRMLQQRWVNWKEASPSLSNMVNEIVQARDGTFWIGTRDGVQMRAPDGRTRWIRALSGVRLGRVTAIGEDEAGRIWIGSGASFAGAFCWNGRTWVHIGSREGLAAPRIHRISKDRRGRLWFLGLGKGDLKSDLSTEPGAFVLEGDRFVRWGKEEGLLDGRVYSFVEDSKGGYWFGTWSGLSRYRNGHWTYWRRGHGLQESRVWTLAVDSTDRVFFSHQYTGLGYFDANDSIHYITREEGLVGYPIFEVEVDRRGWIWVATLDGLGCWTGNDWFRFDSHAGLPNDQLWPVLPLEREVLVGTQGDGVAILRLDQLNVMPPVVRIVSTTITDDDATITWEPHAFWGDQSSALIATRFRMSKSAWSTWSTQHTVTYRDLPPGWYQLDVQARVPLGQKQPPIASRILHIPPPLFLRPAVAIPIITLFSLVIGLTLFGWLRRQSLNRTIRENAAKFRAQYKAIPIPTFTFMKGTDDFILTDYNEAGGRISLGQAAGWVGKRFDDLFPFAPQAKEKLEECLRLRSTLRWEYRHHYQVRPGSVDLDLTFAFVPPDVVLAHVEDVTERKRNEEHLEESREQLRALATRLQSVREEERTMLSREIHDELGQLITGLKMDLAWIRRRAMELGQGIPEAVFNRIAQMNGLLDDAIHTVRKIAGQLRPAVLDDLGLVAAIEWQARDFGDRTGIRCDVALGMDELQMGRERATEFFRIYQELLTNVARHAQATKVQVTLTVDDGVLTLEVRDNGSGISPEAVRRPSSLGILGMEERAWHIRGALSIQPGEKNGTVARVQVPLEQGERV